MYHFKFVVAQPAVTETETALERLRRNDAIRLKRRDDDFQNLFRMRFDFIKHAQPLSNPSLDDWIGVR